MADKYDIQYTHEAAEDIRPLRAFDQRRVLDGVSQSLSFEPSRVSRSRIKRMTQPFWSQYRLRIDDFRAYYDVDEPRRVVQVLRVLFKGSGQTPKEMP
jgi:mRNA-degrading endonuclease RelE of RelBE toxin-antitoxin system